MKKITLLLAALVLGIASGCAQTGKTSGNPVFEGWYADPEAIVYGNECWIFPTYSDFYEKQDHFDAFSSKDLVTWEKHPSVLKKEDISWAEKAMWAPSVIHSNGKYYLFFGANDIQSNAYELLCCREWILLRSHLPVKCREIEIDILPVHGSQPIYKLFSVISSWAHKMAYSDFHIREAVGNAAHSLGLVAPVPGAAEVECHDSTHLRNLPVDIHHERRIKREVRMLPHYPAARRHLELEDLESKIIDEMVENPLMAPAEWIKRRCSLESLRISSLYFIKIMVIKAKKPALKKHSLLDSVLVHQPEQ